LRLVCSAHGKPWPHQAGWGGVGEKGNATLDRDLLASFRAVFSPESINNNSVGRLRWGGPIFLARPRSENPNPYRSTTLVRIPGP